ncbi:MAG TPA: hypothetical protein VE991_10590, partial [Acidimicrobiales bacterium]|nr:hypothetical protein [Acidimicrobiales bacterium]
VIVPAPSGGGKSTLVAGLVGAGCAYLSDEIAAVTAEGILLPYPKPIALRPGAQSLFPQWAQRAVRTGDRWLVTPDMVGGPCRAGIVVVTRYVPGAATALHELSPVDALVALVRHAVQRPDEGGASARRLAALAATCPTYSLVSGDLHAACDAVLDLVGARRGF